MSSTLRIYRVTVIKWPTDDGEPWPRYISAKPDYPDGSPFAGDLEWFAEHAKPGSDAETKFGRFTDHLYGSGGECYGYVLPKTGRRHYLSRAAAESWAAAARFFGAEVAIEASEPVRWPA